MPIARQLQPEVNASPGTANRGPFHPVEAQPQAAAATSSITELVLTQHSPDAQMLLLPMLAHLSRNAERWITWITDAPVNRDELASYGVDTDKVRIIRSQSDESTRWILWEALNTGTSHTVIATLNELNENSFHHLETAAQAGESRALLIRYR
ncbi:cell division inhibitor SulA [Pseudomaricurvus sp.]|uniref:cell division inhibitor SulA n=1 Tax=Pseudomaricurvus sp. TaxID=2004510 RepID=UPI003F6D3E2E